MGNDNLVEKLKESINCADNYDNAVAMGVKIGQQVVSENDLGSHTMFIAEVKAINADEKYIDEKGAFDISKCNLMAYANGGYYSLGKKIGTFGYSVRKKK